MGWERLFAALASLVTAVLPLVEKSLLLLAGKKLQQADTDKHTLMDVVDASNAVASHRADTTDERLQRLAKSGRLRD